MVTGHTYCVGSNTTLRFGARIKLLLLIAIIPALPFMLPKGPLYHGVFLPSHHSEWLWLHLSDLCHYLQLVQAGDIIFHASLNLINQRAIK